MIKNNLVAIILLSTSGIAMGDFTEEEYWTIINKPNSSTEDLYDKLILSSYILGLGEAIYWLEVKNRLEAKSIKHYCPPKSFKPEIGAYHEILRLQFKKRKSLGKESASSLSLEMVNGLQETFPCK